MNFLRALWDTVLVLLCIIVVLFVGIFPNLVFQYFGWSAEPVLDQLSRYIGCILALFLIVYICNKR